MEADDLETKYDNLLVKVHDLENRLAANKGISLPQGIKMPKFDGNGDFYKFLREFNMLATASNWHAPDCVRLFPLFLEGEAKEIYQNIPIDKKRNWRDLTEKMAEHTKRLDGPMWARRMLARAKIGKETVTEFANKIRSWVEQASPEPDYTNDARENESIHYFLSGLPTNIKRKLFFMEKPRSLMEAISLAKKVLQVKEELENDEKGDELKNQIAELTEQVNAIAVINKTNNETENSWDYKNSNWRGNFRDRGNFQNENRGNKWASNRNYKNGRNYNNFGQRNPNFIPLGQRYNQNRRYNRPGGFQNERRNFQTNRDYSQNFRGNPRTRGNDRQRYRINMVSNEAGASPSLRRSPTPVMTFLTISTIFCLLFGGVFGQYQLCSDRVPTTPILLPDVFECSVPNTQRAAETKVTLFLPVRMPKQFPVFNCYQKMTQICTGSYFFLWKEIKSQDTITKGVNYEMCAKFKGSMDISMKRMGENLWATENPEKIKYAWMGEQCETTINNFIEKGNGGILDFFLATSFGHKLNPYKGWEELQRQTFIWEIPEPNEEYWATHFPVGDFFAEITDDAIVIETEQSVFYFEKEYSDAREGIIGVPEEAYKMSNDVFIIIHPQLLRQTREIKQKIEPIRKERPVKQEAKGKPIRMEVDHKNNKKLLVMEGIIPTQKSNVGISTTFMPPTITPTLLTTTKISTKQPRNHSNTSTKKIKLEPTKKVLIVTTQIPKTMTTEIPKIKTTVIPKIKSPKIHTTKIKNETEGIIKVNTTMLSETKIPIKFLEKIQLKANRTQQYYEIKGIVKGKLEVKTEFIKTTPKPKTNYIAPQTTKMPKMEVIKPTVIPTKITVPTISVTTTKPTLTTEFPKIITKEKTQIKVSEKTLVPEHLRIKEKSETKLTISKTHKGVKTNLLEIKTEMKTEKSENQTKLKSTGEQIQKNLEIVQDDIERELGSPENEIFENGDEDEVKDEETSYEYEKKGVLFNLFERDRKKRTTVTTPDARWVKKAEKSKLRRKGGQDNKNTNTRINYALYRLNEDRKKQYDQIFTQACENSNFQLQLAKGILQINPNEGVRRIFNRDDLVARWKGENLEVGFCVPIIPEKILWDKQIGDECYEWVPILAENNTFFIKPGTRELSILGKIMKCDELKEKKNMNETQKRIIEELSQSWNKFRPKYRNIQNPLVLKAGALFESDSTRIEEAMMEYRKKLNNLPASTFRIVQRANITEVIQLIKAEANETLGVVLGKTGNWLELINKIPEKAKEAVGYLKGISIILVVLPIIVLIALIVFIIIKYWSILSAGVRVGTIAARVIRRIIGMKRQKTRVGAVPAAPELNELDSVDQEAYVLDYLPPRRVAAITNDPRKLPSIRVHFNGLLTAALVDSCAAVSYCRESIVRKAGLQIKELNGENANLTAANETNIQILGKTDAKIRIEDKMSGNFGEWEVTLLVSPDKHCPGPLLLGLPLLTDLKGVIALGERKVRLGEVWTSIISVIEAEKPKNMKITMEKDEILEPRSENIMSARVAESFPTNQNFLVNGRPIRYPSIIIGRTLVAPGDSNSVIIQIMNAGKIPVKIYDGSHIADLELVQINALPGDEIHPKDYIPPETRWHEKLPKLPNYALNRNPSDRISLEGTRLSKSAQEELRRLVDKYSEAFVGDDGKIGLYNGQIVHKIDLIPGSLPFHFRPYRYPPETQKEIERQIKIMLDQNIIRESESEFASPIVMVPKADKKSWRFAIDYRAINKMTKKRVFHLPNIQELLDLMGAKKYYTCMDMQQGFMQIPMAPEDIEKTAFISHLGIYEFITMPFGLTAAPDTFQRVMNSLRRRLTAAMLIYLDDIIIGSETEEMHLRDIDNFLKLLKEVGLKLKIEKCHWGMAEIRYLGFLLSEKGVRMDPKQVAVVQNFRAPKTLTELKSLLGALTYFRKFIKNFAHIARPLQILTQDKFEGKIVENWKGEQKESLDTLKRMLTSAPVLQSPRFGKPFVIECDASRRAVGAVLLQENGPVAFASRALNKHEANYPSIEREALGLVYSVKEFSPYIVGSGITKVITDCSALTGIMKAKELKGRLEKYQVTLQSYDLNIVYRPGKKNKAADFLSRYNIPGIEEENEKPAQNKNAESKTEILSTSKKALPIALTEKIMDKNVEISVGEILREQRKVKEIAKIFYILKTGKFPNDDSKWRKITQNYCLINDLIYYTNGKENKEDPKLLIPYSVRKQVFDVIHNTGHFGFEKTFSGLKERFHWNGMKEDVKLLVETCEKCQKRKILPGQTKSAPGVPIPPAGLPFQRVHCDLMGPLKKTAKGNSYIFVVIDSFSKLLMAKSIPDQKANTVSETFVEMVIHQQSTPEIVVTDQGRQFTSEIFNDLSKIYGFEHKMSTPYHQQANGQAEGSMRIIANIVSQLINESGNNWDEVLSHAIFIYNTSIHSSTNLSPFFILHLRHPRMPTDQLLKLPPRNKLVSDVSVYTRNHAEKALKAWELVKESILKSQITQKNENDKCRKAEEREFEIGELVLLKKEVLKHKFDQKWIGPFRCVGIEKDKKNLIIQSLEGKGKFKKVHQEKVKKFNGPAILPLRESDEPLNWEKYVNDPNLEQEEAETMSEISEKGDEELKKAKNMSKFGFESSDEEEEQLKVAFVRNTEPWDVEENEQLVEQIEIFDQEEELPCTITEIFLDGELIIAYTSWPETNLISFTSLVPSNLINDHWEVLTNNLGERYITAWFLGTNFDLFLNDEVDKVVLGIHVQFLINDVWYSKIDRENETYWEKLGENDGESLEIQRIPDLSVTYLENLAPIEFEIGQNNEINLPPRINVISAEHLFLSILDLNEDMENESEESAEISPNNKDINEKLIDFEKINEKTDEELNILAMEPSNEPKVVPFDDQGLIREEKRLKDEIETLERKLKEMKEQKNEREKRAKEKEETKIVDEVILDFEEEEEIEETAEVVRKSRLNPAVAKFIVEEAMNEKWDGNELIVIDPRGRKQPEVPGDEKESRKREDLIREEQRDSRDKAWLDFIATTTSLDKMKENRLKAEKVGLGTNGRRMAEISVRAAEKTIFEKPCIRPEGLKRGFVWNQIENQEEKERRKRFANRTPPYGHALNDAQQNSEQKVGCLENDQPIFTKILNIQQKLNEAIDGMKKLEKHVERLVNIEKTTNERNDTKGDNFLTNFNEFGVAGTSSWRNHDESRWQRQVHRGRWTNPRRQAYPRRNNIFHSNNGWNAHEEQTEAEPCTNDEATR